MGFGKCATLVGYAAKRTAYQAIDWGDTMQWESPSPDSLCTSCQAVAEHYHVATRSTVRVGNLAAPKNAVKSAHFRRKTLRHDFRRVMPKNKRIPVPIAAKWIKLERPRHPNRRPADPGRHCDDRKRGRNRERGPHGSGRRSRDHENPAPTVPILNDLSKPSPRQERGIPRYG